MLYNNLKMPNKNKAHKNKKKYSQILNKMYNFSLKHIKKGVNNSLCIGYFLYD